MLRLTIRNSAGSPHQSFAIGTCYLSCIGDDPQWLERLPVACLTPNYELASARRRTQGFHKTNIRVARSITWSHNQMIGLVLQL